MYTIAGVTGRVSAAAANDRGILVPCGDRAVPVATGLEETLTRLLGVPAAAS